jgi:uncharacterized protein (TIGR03067 family)
LVAAEGRAREEGKDVARPESGKLDGKWWLVEAERDGTKTGAIVIVASRRCLIIKGTKFTEVVGQGMSVFRGDPISETWYNGTLDINWQADPNEIDFRYEDVKDRKDRFELLENGKPEQGDFVQISARKSGTTSKGIFKFDEDKLVICVSDSERPKGFATKPKDKIELQVLNRSGIGRWR